MGDLSRNISRYEIACNCGCGFDSMDIKTIEIIQECAEHVKDATKADQVIININSGCRCFAWNDHEGGSEDSPHMQARAIDFWFEIVTNIPVIGWSADAVKHERSKIDPCIVYNYLNSKYKGQYGFGRYTDFTHADTRSGHPARW